MLLEEISKDKVLNKKKRVRKFISKVLSVKKVVVLFIKEVLVLQEKEKKVEVESKKVEEKKKEKEMFELNGLVEREGSVVGSVESLSAGDETGSVKNGVVFKKDKEVVCIVCE